MNITILNGNPDERSPEFDRYLTDLTDDLAGTRSRRNGFDFARDGYSIVQWLLRLLDQNTRRMLLAR